MKGSITKRGKNSYRLKFDAGRDAKGARKIQYVTVRGSKRDAQQKLADLISDVGKGTYVKPSKITAVEFVRGRVDQWEASGEISARTAQRYRQLVGNQITKLGDKTLQQLRRMDIEEWHNALRTGRLAARTIGHAHRVLGKALKEAENDGLILRNPCRQQRAPKVVDQEITIARDVPDLLAKLKGTSMYVRAVLALFTGMRLGEILALRDSRVDLDRKVIQVREAIEYTRAHGIRFKVPKSKAGRRDITLPDIAVDALREHRLQILELRMKLGAGPLPRDALLFADLEGNAFNPDNVSAEWSDTAERIGYGEISFHALRHTHASWLISRKVDVVTISKRLGHSSPVITLKVYAHLFTTDDSAAAEAINAAMAGA